MRANAIVGARKRKFKVMPREDATPPAPNLLKREFEVDVPNAVWAGDMTYLWTPAGWVFLAVVLDLFSRRVVGWAISRKPNAQLMIDAMAVRSMSVVQIPASSHIRIKDASTPQAHTANSRENMGFC